MSHLRHALTAALLLAAAAAPGHANHDPVVGNRSTGVTARPCKGMFSLVESPGEQSPTNPITLSRITATIWLSCNGSPIWLDYHSSSIQIRSTTATTPSPSCYNSSYADTYPMTGFSLSCSIVAPRSGNYTATYTTTLHPWVAPTGAEPDCVQTAGWDGLYKTCTGSLSTVVL